MGRPVIFTAPQLVKLGYFSKKVDFLR
ncbi:hypothetical protein KKC1_26050 [Calderihabitans maritimus]|uniref:Uncharacterized protein n=1 Tax=Calderihabitans maritimus TaxID=1246530 RepID=A0A1Z5HVC1_9FIRM|nr:hypothetical protein KKC1_26050 [Calderihabitans maritimus]